MLSFFLPRNVVLVSVPSLLDPDFAPKVGAVWRSGVTDVTDFPWISCILDLGSLSCTKCIQMYASDMAKAAGQHHPIHLDASTNFMTHWPCAGHCLSAHVFFSRAVRLCPTVPDCARKKLMHQRCLVLPEGNLVHPFVSFTFI